MWIKICANTNLADAQLAAELGADALGFVFAPSKRQVTAEQVAAITPHLPSSVETIAVVQTRDPHAILDLIRRTGVTGVQLHGGLDLPLVRTLRAALGASVSIIQTLHWTVTENGEDEDNATAALVAAQLREIAAEPAITRVLLDAKVGNAGGGTGRSFDWNAAREVLTAANEAAAQAHRPHRRRRPASRKCSRSHSCASALGCGCGKRCGGRAGAQGSRQTQAFP